MVSIDIEPWRRASLGIFGRLFEGQSFEYFLFLIFAAYLNFYLFVFDHLKTTGLTLLFSESSAASVFYSLYVIASVALFFGGLILFGFRKFILAYRRPTRALRRATRCRMLIPHYQLRAVDVWRDMVSFRKRVTPASRLGEGQRRAIAKFLHFIGYALMMPGVLGCVVVASGQSFPINEAVSAAACGSALVIFANRLLAPVEHSDARRAWSLRLVAAIVFIVLLGVIYAAFALLKLTTGNVALLAIGIPTFWAARKLWKAGNIYLGFASNALLPTSQAVRTRDRRKPILFLRSFTDDWAKIPWSKSLSDKDENVRFEEIIADDLAYYGPPIAIADPKGIIKTRGAAKAHLADDKWQQEVLDWMHDALAIVIIAGSTPGVLWEIEQVVRNNYMEKTILLVPPGGIIQVDWQAIASLFQGTRWYEQMSSADMAGALAAIELSNGEFIVFASQHRVGIDYSLALGFALYGIVCRRHE